MGNDQKVPILTGPECPHCGCTTAVITGTQGKPPDVKIVAKCDGCGAATAWWFGLRHSN